MRPLRGGGQPPDSARATRGVSPPGTAERARPGVRHWLPVLVTAAFLTLAVGLAVHSVYWLATLTGHPIGEDFDIYERALAATRDGANPYLPYAIGRSFVNHPFALSLLSCFSWMGPALALLAWMAASAVVWLASTALAFALAFKARDSGPGVLFQQEIALASLAIFAPFLETVYLGQINAFAVVAICLCFFFSAQHRPSMAGLFLALAIVLKTSPILLLLYFLCRGERRVVGSTIAAILALSAIPALQFGPQVLTDFLTLLPRLGWETHLSPYNESLLSVLIQMGQRLGWHGSWKLLLMLVRGGLAAVTVVACWRAFAGRRASGVKSLVNGGAFIMLVVVSSPLLWYHHSVFLLVPLVLLLTDPRPLLRGMGAGAALVVQAERLFEQVVVPVGIPVVAAHLLLLTLLLAWPGPPTLRPSPDRGGRP